VGQRADGDDVDTGRGDIGDGGQVDVAACLDQRATVHESDAGAKFVKGEVVEHDRVNTAREDGDDLVDAVDLDLKMGGVADRGAHLRDRFRDAESGRGEHGEVVVFGEDGVAETEAVVVSPAAGDGVAVQNSKTGHGLAGVDDAGASSCHEGHIV
jgi:hypothetical protein